MDTNKIESTLNRLFHDEEQQLRLCIDCGIKVKYDKSGDLLAEFKAVTGSKADN